MKFLRVTNLYSPVFSFTLPYFLICSYWSLTKLPEIPSFALLSRMRSLLSILQVLRVSAHFICQAQTEPNQQTRPALFSLHFGYIPEAFFS